MEHYVTLFDLNFLPQGLALQESLRQHSGDFTLWVLCLDKEVQMVLNGLGKPNLRTIPLNEVETPELLAVKSERSRAEYCWTLTPFAPKAVMDREPSARRVTYLDADLYFLKSPTPVFNEFETSGKNVLITEHAYDAEYDQSATSGRFCVQFMTFTREGSEPVRQWWERRCIEWCYATQEDNKFGDQKYLDDWPERFSTSVHVLQQEEFFQAPWNARRFPYSKAISWHFHGLRITGRRVRWYVGYEIPLVVEEEVYRPYVELLEEKVSEVGAIYIRQDVSESRFWSIVRAVKFILRESIILVQKIRRRRVSHFSVR